MKKIAIAILLVAAVACKNDPGKTTDEKLSSGKVIIKGQIDGTDTGSVEIISVLNSVANIPKADTIRVVNGKFEYNTNLTEPAQMALRRTGTQGEELVFFADPGEIEIKTHYDSIYSGKVTAGASQKLYKEAEDSIRKIMEKGKSLYESYVIAQTKQNAAEMQRIQQEFYQTMKAGLKIEINRALLESLRNPAIQTETKPPSSPAG